MSNDKENNISNSNTEVPPPPYSRIYLVDGDYWDCEKREWLGEYVIDDGKTTTSTSNSSCSLSETSDVLGTCESSILENNNTNFNTIEYDDDNDDDSVDIVCYGCGEIEDSKETDEIKGSEETNENEDSNSPLLEWPVPLVDPNIPRYSKHPAIVIVESDEEEGDVNGNHDPAFSSVEEEQEAKEECDQIFGKTRSAECKFTHSVHTYNDKEGNTIIFDSVNNHLIVESEQPKLWEVQLCCFYRQEKGTLGAYSFGQKFYYSMWFLKRIVLSRVYLEDMVTIQGTSVVAYCINVCGKYLPVDPFNIYVYNSANIYPNYCGPTGSIFSEDYHKIFAYGSTIGEIEMDRIIDPFSRNYIPIRRFSVMRIKDEKERVEWIRKRGY